MPGNYEKRDLRGVDSTRREKRMAGVREIAYVASPTAERMHNSLKRVRGIRGPIGCLPCDTEVMTPDGWIRIADWDGQEILQWEPFGETLRFEKPKRFINAENVDGFLSYPFIGGGRMVVTANHRVVCREPGEEYWHVLKAWDLANWSDTKCRLEIPSDPSGPKLMINTRLGRIHNADAPDGRQYCFETDTGFFVVRQFGNVFVTGNSGKSVACCWDIRYRTERMPPDSLGVRHARWLIARSTFAQIKKTTIPTWLRWFPDTEIRWGSPTIGVLRQPSMRGDGTTVEIELIFQGIRFNESLESLKSLDLSGAWMNEASDIRADALDAVLGRCGRFPDTSMVPGAVNLGVTMDTNSPGETNWWYQLAEVKQPEDYDFFAQPPAVFRREKDGHVWYEANRGQEEGIPAAENADHLADGYDYWLNLTKGAAPDYIKRFLMNEYTNEVKGSPVYHEYIDALHFVNEEIEPMWGLPLILGTDYGRTPSSVILQVRPDSQIVVFDELCTKDCSIDEYVDRWLKPWLINKYKFGQGARIVSYGDPAGANKEQGISMSVIQIMTMKGVPTMPCPVLNNDFMLRRDAVGDSLRRRVTEGKPGLVICRPCVNLRKGFLGDYHYRQMVNADGSVRTADRPDKRSDDPSSHIHDALQYAVYSVLHPDGRDPFSTKGVDAKLWLPRSEEGRPETVGLDLAGFF